MRQKQTIPFLITGIDSLGQGVSKVTDKVTFIPKTAPGDQGEAYVMAQKKGVAFARLKTLEKSSDLRISPICPHFESCPSCHFLHLPYENELNFKKESYEKLFRKLPLPNLEVIAAPDRLHYRNRVQLHYSLKSKLLGMKDPRTFEMIPVPECLIGTKEVSDEMKRLYENDQWMKEVPTAPMEGHVEIYWKDQKLLVNWNRPYAEGGFTQVYGAMNQKLKEVLKEEWLSHPSFELLDLFGGNGNLSQNLNYSKRLCVDMYSQKMEEEYFSQDLYGDQALKNVRLELRKMNLNPSHLLLDPPRSGLKNLPDWINSLKPKFLAYVSCDPHTLARDLQQLEDYQIKRALLVDFFPSTFHFESLIFLERKS